MKTSTNIGSPKIAICNCNCNAKKEIKPNGWKTKTMKKARYKFLQMDPDRRRRAKLEWRN
jgi:hypothetical protein